MVRVGHTPRSPRLAAIAGLIPPGSRVVDIGCDHARLAVGLIATGRASAVIATEAVEELLAPLRARDLPAVQDGRLELRVGDGFDALTTLDRADVVVLAGIGTPTILGILSRLPRGVGIRRAILQPQTDAGRLRAWLAERLWDIVDECCVESRGRYYAIVAATPDGAGAMPPHPVLSRDDLCEAGPWLVSRRDPCAARHWARTLQRYERILATTPPGPDRAATVALRDRARRIVDVLR